MIPRDDILPLDTYKYVLLHGKKHSGKKCAIRLYLQQYFSSFTKEEIKINQNTYIYALSKSNLFEFSFIDVFCNPQQLFNFAFKRLYNESIFHDNESIFVCTDLHLCHLKWQVYLYKMIDTYPNIRVILSTEHIHLIHPNLKARCLQIRVPDISLFVPKVHEFKLTKETLRKTIHSLMVNLIDTREVLKSVTNKLLEMNDASEENTSFILKKSCLCFQKLNNCSDFYHQYIIEAFVLVCLT